MGETLKFVYINWQGKVGVRTVVNPELCYGSTEYHKERQWLLVAYDMDKKEHRTFAVKDIIKFI